MISSSNHQRFRVCVPLFNYRIHTEFIYRELNIHIQEQQQLFLFVFWVSFLRKKCNKLCMISPFLTSCFFCRLFFHIDSLQTKFSQSNFSHHAKSNNNDPSKTNPRFDSLNNTTFNTSAKGTRQQPAGFRKQTNNNTHSLGFVRIGGHLLSAPYLTDTCGILFLFLFFYKKP